MLSRPKIFKANGVEFLEDGRYRLTRIAVENDCVKSVLGEIVLDGRDSRDELRKLGYRQGEPTVFALPSAGALFHWLTLPTLDSRQISKMMSHEARSRSPWPEADLHWAYRVIARHEGEGYTQIMLILARSERVQSHLEVLRECGVRPTRVEVSSLSLGRLIETTEESPVLLHVGAHDFELVRCSANMIRFVRATERDCYASDFVCQTRSLEPDIDDACYDRLLVVAETDTAWSDLEAEMPGIRRIEEANLAKLNGLTRLEPRLVIGVGAALAPRDQTATDDLMPQAERRRITIQALVRQVMLAVPALTWLVAVLYGLNAYLLHQERQYIEETGSAVRELRSLAGDLEAQAERLSALRGEYTDVSLPLEIVLELYVRTPQAIALSFMSWDAKGVLVIGGDAPSYTALLNYVSELQESKVFREVKMNYGTQPRSSAFALVDFKITCRVRPKDRS